MRIVKRGKKYLRLAYTSSARPILEYGAACWNPYKECQIRPLDRVQNKGVKSAHHTEVRFGNTRLSVKGQQGRVQSV
jgi:hypothetical protein